MPYFLFVNYLFYIFNSFIVTLKILISQQLCHIAQKYFITDEFLYKFVIIYFGNKKLAQLSGSGAPKNIKAVETIMIDTTTMCKIMVRGGIITIDEAGTPLTL